MKLLPVWLFLACSSSNDASTSPASNFVIIEVGGGIAIPATVHVARGGTVEFSNVDIEAHHIVSSKTSSTAEGATIDSESVTHFDPGTRFKVTLPDVGEITYHCKEHPSLTGAIEVE